MDMIMVMMTVDRGGQSGVVLFFGRQNVASYYTF